LASKGRNHRLPLGQPVLADRHVVASIMRARLQIGGYEIEYDRDATAACYARIRVPAPEDCGCAYCRNWVAAREHVLSLEFRDLLSQLAIPTNGEIEVWETPGQALPHLYGGWYFFVGRILSGEPDRTFHVGQFTVWFTSGKSFAVPEFEGQEVCELQFVTEVGEYLPESEYD
jgi:hypothetical protein